MLVLAIDPGPEQSAYVVWDGLNFQAMEILPNDDLLSILRTGHTRAQVLAIEQIKSYGKAVSDTIFNTVFWSGRFVEAWNWNRKLPWHRIPRMEIKMHLCHAANVKDSNIRCALIDRFEPGLKPKERPKGILKGLAGDTWAAFALAVTWIDKYDEPFTTKLKEAFHVELSTPTDSNAPLRSKDMPRVRNLIYPGI